MMIRPNRCAAKCSLDVVGQEASLKRKRDAERFVIGNKHVLQQNPCGIARRPVFTAG